MQEGANIGANVVEEGVVQDDHMMQACVTTTQRNVMQGSDTFGQDVKDFIDDHLSNDDVDLDGGAGGVGTVADGVGGGDDKGDGAGDVDDGDGAEGDGDNPSDDDGNQADDEGHEVIPVVKRTRKISDRITKNKAMEGCV
ncbi:unnamed protein product [Lactuca virosa]|uniref:Uncharacterized protein n=1 Tax=Lactuca virosa TaxID=75947 RepID=A0AAU9M484_9ASTR|nr:unnamed protein product [Lactuca virosa]